MNLGNRKVEYEPHFLRIGLFFLILATLSFVFRIFGSKKIDVRIWVQRCLLIYGDEEQAQRNENLLRELVFLQKHFKFFNWLFKILKGKRVLYAGQSYYNAWYLSRSLREIGWSADLLNWDLNPNSQIYYHGEDIRFSTKDPYDLENDLRFYVNAIYSYDIFHFSNSNGICFGFPLQNFFKEYFMESHFEIYLLKKLGKKIVYSNNGCLDGVSQTSFSKWGPESVCSICIWKENSDVCSDQKNLEWGKFRNEVADYQCLSGGNRADYNIAPTVHEAPQFYCLDKSFWRPDLEIPERYKLPNEREGTVRLYHSVGNKKDRTNQEGINIKSTHVYLPLIEKLKAEGMNIEILKPEGVPNREVRFIQAQADIFLDMLTFGWFGATAREAMMLGKPVVCFIRPEWLEDVRKEIPDYADELPIVSATPQSIEQVLKDLILNSQKRKEIGQRSRDFAVKWHSSETAAEFFDKVYSSLLDSDPLHLKLYSQKFDLEKVYE